MRQLQAFGADPDTSLQELANLVFAEASEVSPRLLAFLAGKAFGVNVMLYQLPYGQHQLGESSDISVHLLASSAGEYGVLYPSLFNLADGWNDAIGQFEAPMPLPEINWLAFPFAGGHQRPKIDPQQFELVQTTNKDLATQTFPHCISARYLSVILSVPQTMSTYSLTNCADRLEKHAQLLGISH